MFVFVLGGVAACASVLGYDKNFERGSDDAGVESGGQGDGAIDATNGAPRAGDAAAPDASGESMTPGGDAALDTAVEAAVGVPCGAEVCQAPDVCCRSMGLLDMPLGCTSHDDCLFLKGGNYQACDGNEDCPAGHVCCITAAHSGDWSADCSFTSASCISDRGALACTVREPTCDCKPASGGCLPLQTCGGSCAGL
jgi:hypothetical protein